MSDKKRAPQKVTIDYKNGKIYKLVNDVNDMIYVGSTTTTLSRRFSSHKQMSKASTANIYTAMRVIGVDHFKIILIELFSCTCKEELEAREYAVLKEFSRETVYNSLFDGKPDEATRQKLRENNAMRGKFGADCHVFKRGSISQYKSKAGQFGWQFGWQEKGKQRAKTWTFPGKRTSEMAYQEAVAYRDKMFPLTNQDGAEE